MEPVPSLTTQHTSYGGDTINAGSNNTLTFNGTSTFINNSAGSGGAIYTLDNTVLSFSGTSNLINNSVGDGGGTIFTYSNNTLTFNGTIYFTNNGQYGGGGRGRSRHTEWWRSVYGAKMHFLHFT